MEGHGATHSPNAPTSEMLTLKARRVVEYTPGYLADQWCSKGHVVYCLKGELFTELQDGRAFLLKPGMTLQVADGETPHRSSTVIGARVFIVD